jgi:hypothetical protein
MTDALLAGLLLCQVDGKLLDEWTLDGKRVYACSGPSGCTYVDADQLEKEIAGRVLAVFASPRVMVIREAYAATRGFDAAPMTPRDLAEWFVQGDRDRRREILDTVLMSVTVRPAVGDEPLADRLTFGWK